jgi:hypothetical protein
MHRSARSYDYLWLSLTLLPLIGISFLISIQPQDYWWLMRVGRDTLLSGHIPTTDTISFSQYGQPIIYQAWLAGVIFWMVYNLGGASLTFLLRGTLIGLAYGLIWVMARRVSGPRLASILVLVMGLASANNWSMRAQLFAYPLFALCLWSLLEWQEGRSKGLWLLPLSVFLWVNLHGSFILPLVLAGITVIFGKGDRKPLIIVMAVMLLATLLNPHGLGVWRYFAFMLNSPSDHSFAFEWAAPRNVGWQMNLFFGWMLAFGPLAALAPRKPSLLVWALFLAFGWLALSGLRYVIWFLFILTVLTAALLAEWTCPLLDRPVRVRSPVLNVFLASLILANSLLFLPGLREHWWHQAMPVYAPETTPVAATEWLAEHPDLHGPLWSDYAFGGYLSFTLPSRPPWMDSRFNAFPAGQWEEYVRVSRGAPEWQAVLDREGINLLLLSTAAQPWLVEAVDRSDVWCERYRDPHAVIFSRCVPIS